MGLYGAGLYGAGTYASPTNAVEVDTWPPRVLVSVTALLSYGTTAITIFREVAGVRTVLRGADGVDTAGQDAFVREDAELPFGVPVRWVAILETPTGDVEVGSPTLTVTIEKVAVSDAINGNAAQVVILAWPEKTFTRRSSVFAVGGRSVVISGQRTGFNSDISFITESDSARENFDALLQEATSGVLQIRQQGGYGGVDCYIAVLGDTEARHSQDGSDPRRRWTLDAQQVEGWPTNLETQGFTLEDLADAVSGETILAYDTETPGTTLLDIATWDIS